MADIRICIRDVNGILRRVTKIVPYNNPSDPGFAALVPYHSARRGFLLKHSNRYDHPIGLVPMRTAIPFEASDRVKLSIHLNGFVQFSGHDSSKIHAGRDPITGEPRGIGVVFDHPIEITSGPLFTTVVWGLDQFDIQGDPKGRCLEFTDEDVYRDRPLLCGLDQSAYLVEFFMFRKSHFESDRRSGPRGEIAMMELPRSDTLIAYRHELRVNDLPGQPHFLGCLVSIGSTNATSPSGYTMSGPAFAPYGSDDFVTVSAHYPAPDYGQEAPESTSLDRTPPS